MTCPLSLKALSAIGTLISSFAWHDHVLWLKTNVTVQNRWLPAFHKYTKTYNTRGYNVKGFFPFIWTNQKGVHILGIIICLWQNDKRADSFLTRKRRKSVNLCESVFIYLLAVNNTLPTSWKSNFDVTWFTGDRVVERNMSITSSQHHVYLFPCLHLTHKGDLSSMHPVHKISHVQHPVCIWMCIADAQWASHVPEHNLPGRLGWASCMLHVHNRSHSQHPVYLCLYTVGCTRKTWASYATYITDHTYNARFVSRLGLVVGRSAGKRKDIGSTPRFGSPFSSKIVIYGHCLVTLPCTINETLKWCTSLPFLMRKSFWWWQCSG